MAFSLRITGHILKFVPYLPIDGELLRVSDHKLHTFIMFTQEPMNSAAPGEVPILSLSFLRDKSVEILIFCGSTASTSVNY